MRLKKIYTKNGVLTHEYFVNKDDKEKIIVRMGWNDEMKDDIGDLLSRYGEEQCVLIETHTDCTLMIDGIPFSSDMLLRGESDKDSDDEDTFQEKEHKPYFKSKYKK